MRRDQGLAALRSLLPVSRETEDRLTLLVSLVEKWQRAENLIAPSTLPDIWRRHVVDSAQVLPLFPEARRWLDLGSGGGFPGLVVAVFMAEQPGAMVHLVESNGRKCAFLRAAARETGAPVTVHQARIEDVLADWAHPVDVITARALASLSRLLDMTSALIGPDRPATFFKGVDYRAEIAEAQRSYTLDLIEYPSRVAEGSVILEVRRAVAKAGGPKAP